MHKPKSKSNAVHIYYYFFLMLFTNWLIVLTVRSNSYQTIPVCARVALNKPSIFTLWAYASVLYRKLEHVGGYPGVIPWIRDRLAQLVGKAAGSGVLRPRWCSGPPAPPLYIWSSDCGGLFFKPDYFSGGLV